MILALLLALVPQQAPDFICYPGRVLETATGTLHKLPDTGELDWAIEHSDPAGSVIECNGALPGVSLGLGENYRRYEVVRQEPIRVTLVAGPEHQSIGALAWGDKRAPGGGPGLAVERFELVGITVDGRFAQSPLAGFVGTKLGDIRFERVTLLSTQGNTKWGSRIMARARTLTAVGCIFVGGGQEHAFYWDAPLDSITFEDNIAQGWRRTMLQVVLREAKYGGTGGPAATGDLIIDGNVAKDCGADGAANFTVAGWPEGNVWFRGNRAASQFPCGMFVAYRDFKMGGLVNAGGYAVGNLVWNDNTARFPGGDRDINAFGSVEHLTLRVGQVRMSLQAGPKAAFQLAEQGQPCGEVLLESRSDPLDPDNGWNLQTGQGPFRKGKVDLKPAEVRAMWARPATTEELNEDN